MLLTDAAADDDDDDADVEENVVEDGDEDSYDNEVPSNGDQLFASDLRLKGDHSTHSQPHTADMQTIDHDDQSRLLDNRHVILAPPIDTGLVTSLQVRCVSIQI